jgi:hypothetical protein
MDIPAATLLPNLRRNTVKLTTAALTARLAQDPAPAFGENGQHAKALKIFENNTRSVCLLIKRQIIPVDRVCRF